MPHQYKTYIDNPETGERRRLTTPASPFADNLPVFSPDSSLLAFVRVRGGLSSDVFVVPVQGGEARKLTSLDAAMDGIDWTADGKQIVVAALSREAGYYSLWRVALAGGKAERLSQLGSEAVSWPTVSRHGNRLAYVQNVENSNIWQFRLTSPRQLNGRPVRLISSTRTESGMQYSQDGKRIAFVSNRSGSAQIWTCAQDGSNLAQLTFLKANDAGTPRWSPDGRRIAFDSTASGIEGVYLISADGGAPQPLVVDSFANSEPSFSRDGHSIYFVSDRSGTDEIWKVVVTGGQPVKVTSHGGSMPLESTDGKFLYHLKVALGEAPSPESAGLWRIPVSGGEDTRVLHQGLYGGGMTDFFWTVSPIGIYFIDDTSPRPNLKLLDPATGNTTTVAALDKPPYCGNPALAVSPDGHTLLYSQVDNFTRDIMLVENFR